MQDMRTTKKYNQHGGILLIAAGKLHNKRVVVRFSDKKKRPDSKTPATKNARGSMLLYDGFFSFAVARQIVHFISRFFIMIIPIQVNSTPYITKIAATTGNHSATVIT